MYSGLHPDDRTLLSEAALNFFQNEKAAFDISFRIKTGKAADYRVIHARGERSATDDGACLAYVWFMDEGLYGYDERMCMWEALEDSTIMMCETTKVRSLIHSNGAFKDLWILILELSVRYKLYRENGFLVENATERYIHFKKLYPGVCNRVPQKYVATYLGITPESLSRIRSVMKDE
jgi:CRP-like cAMP-binding protein